MDRRSYLMGVFDGEGCVGTGKDRQGYYYTNVSVTMCSLEIVTQLQQEWGGQISHRRKPTTGGMVLYAWIMSGSKAIPFLEYAVERSLTKRPQCAIALEMARNMARYKRPGVRRGTNLHGGDTLLSAADRAERERLVMEIRALNGARTRWAPQSLPAPAVPVILEGLDGPPVSRSAQLRLGLE